MQHDPKTRYKRTNKQKSHYRTQWMTSYAPNWYIYTCIENEMYMYIPYKCINTNIKHLTVGHSVVQ